MHDQRPQVRCAAAGRGADRRHRERDIVPILPGRLGDLGAPDQFKRRLFAFAAGIEPRVIKRYPARTAHRIGHAQGCRRGGANAEIDAQFELARRIGPAFGIKTGERTVDLALLYFRLAHGAIGGGDFLGHSGEGRTPFTERPRFAFVADTGRRAFRETFGKFSPRIGGGNRAVERGALIAQRLDTPVDLGEIGRRRRPRRAYIDSADGQICAALALNTQR